MDIIITDRRLSKCANDNRKRVREYGKRQSDLIGVRLGELKAADNLEVMRALPRARCHELSGDRKGQLAVDLDYPFRLIFVPNHNPVPMKTDGGLNWSEVICIEVIEVVNYHED